MLPPTLGGLTLIATAIGFMWYRGGFYYRIDPIREKISASETAWRTHKTGKGPDLNRQNVDALYALISGLHPEFDVTWKGVSDDRNGFLKWQEFETRLGGKLDLPKELQDLNYQTTPRDQSKLADELEKHLGLLDDIRTIGLLPDQSAKGIRLRDWGMTGASVPTRACALLCLQAESYAAKGAREAALEDLRAAMGIASHFDKIETPSLLQETIAILIRLNVQDVFLKHILPVLEIPPHELGEWEKVVAPPAASPKDFGILLRGEWHVSLRYLMLPQMIRGDDPHEAPDPERFIEGWTAEFKQRIDVCDSSTLSNLEARFAAVPPVTTSMSKQSRALLDVSLIGNRSWVGGWIRAQVIQARTAAVFAHLEGKPLPMEPLTGLPFVWDASAKTLSPPADPRLVDLKIDPVHLSQ